MRACQAGAAMGVVRKRVGGTAHAPVRELPTQTPPVHPRPCSLYLAVSRCVSLCLSVSLCVPLCDCVTLSRLSLCTCVRARVIALPVFVFRTHHPCTRGTGATATNLKSLIPDSIGEWRTTPPRGSPLAPILDAMLHEGDVPMDWP